MAQYEIPLSPSPQRFSVDLAGRTYILTLMYRDCEQGGWTLDIATDESDILLGIPLVPGTDLLAQHKHLDIGGSLYVQTMGDINAPPTVDNLGEEALVYFIT